MDFGVATVTRGECSSREGYIAVAEAAERLGFGFISVNDHVVVPRDIASRYPYSESGEWAARTVGECLDQLATLAFLAARTERLQLLTSVMVVPQRQPVLTAKMLATIDVLSKGRLIVGCGVGWLKEEFEALGAPPFAERGRATDEYLDAMKALWTQDAPKFAGQARELRRYHLRAQAGRQAAPAHLDRRRERGRAQARPCAWAMAGIRPPTIRSTGSIRRRGSARRWASCGASPRPRGAIPRPSTSAISCFGRWTGRRRRAADGARRLFTGSSADMAADAAALGSVGVRHVALTFQTATVAETLDRMQRFAGEVMPLARHP